MGKPGDQRFVHASGVLVVDLMNTLFQSAPLTLDHWMIMLGYGIVVMLLVEGEKAAWRMKKAAESEH